MSDNNIIFKRYLISTFSCGLAEILTFPLETCKVHMQVYSLLNKNSSSNKLHKNAFKTFYDVVSNQGFTALYTGSTPSVFRQLIYGGAAVWSYKILLWSFFGHKNSKVVDPVTDLNIWKRGFVAGFTGAIMQVSANPFEITKIRLQSDVKNKMLNNVAPRYTSFTHAIRTIYTTEGLAGLFVGARINAQRGALINIGWMGGFEQSKATLLNTKLYGTDFIFTDSLILHVLCSQIAGTLAGLISSPLDVIRTRSMAQDSAGIVKPYRSSVQCILDIIKTDGFFGLYRGFGPGLIRNNLWSLIFFVTFENLNKQFT